MQHLITDTFTLTGAQTTLASLSVNLHSTGHSAFIAGSAPNVLVPCSRASGGYIQMDTVIGAPPAADCNAAAEYGRMKFDSSTGVNKLCICGADGWAVFDQPAQPPALLNDLFVD